MPIIGTDVEAAAAKLRRGELVAFATETVYGLGADAQSPPAMAKLYALKGRPANHPVIVHLPDFAQATKWAAEIPPAAENLAAAFMPGPLTLLLPATPHAVLTTGGGDTVALRVPSHPLAQRLLAAFGGGIAAPSANRFGRLSPTAAAHVVDEFAATDDLYVLEGGQSTVGLESAIVACLHGTVSILRPGVLSAEKIAEVAGQSLLLPPSDLRAPGRLPRHYAPHTPLLLSAHCPQLPDKMIAAFSRHCPPGVAGNFWRCAPANAADYAHCLYATVRELDELQADFLWVELPPSSWHAVRDRLSRMAPQKQVSGL